MRNCYFRWLLLLATGPLFCQCSQAPDAAPKIDYRQTGITLMQQLTPQLTGTWDLRRVAVKRLPNNYYQDRVGVTKDTVFQNFAVLAIAPAVASRYTPRDPQYGEFEGTLQYAGKAFPVYFALRVADEYASTAQGPQAGFLFEFNYEPGSYPLDLDRQFLTDLGVVGDNFSLETTPGQPSMVWRGLNRGLDRIELQKR